MLRSLAGEEGYERVDKYIMTQVTGISKHIIGYGKVYLHKKPTGNYALLHNIGNLL